MLTYMLKFRQDRYSTPYMYMYMYMYNMLMRDEEGRKKQARSNKCIIHVYVCSRQLHSSDFCFGCVNLPCV